MSFKEHIIKIKYFLVFFCALYVLSCTQKRQSKPIQLHYENGKAVSVTFSVLGSPKDYSVFLKENNIVSVLGDFSVEDGWVRFVPLVPFSNGQTYEIRKGNSVYGNFTVKGIHKGSAPELVAIYPTKDTVPQNLLKMYFVFSEPMQYVGNPLELISVFDETESIEIHPFLELENELWSKDQTRLTLWLDPGRIKTDLIPNREKGLPLKQGHSYRISIHKDWKSSQGVSLAEAYGKYFYVKARDQQIPSPKEWIVNAPEKNSINPLVIDFQEPMDAMLAKECIIISNNNQNIKGRFNLVRKDQAIEFHPKKSWAAGRYTITVNPIFEDLAGNNLSRLFDTDLGHREKPAHAFTEETLSFTLK